VKTTLELPDELLIEAKKAAAEQRRPLKALVEEGLRLVLRGVPKKTKGNRVRLVTVKGGLPRDLDLSSREKTMDWIEKNR
jgi:hypothetical protein